MKLYIRLKQSIDFSVGRFTVEVALPTCFIFTEGSENSSVSWDFDFEDSGLCIKSVKLFVESKTYEDAR